MSLRCSNTSKLLQADLRLPRLAEGACKRKGPLACAPVHETGHHRQRSHSPHLLLTASPQVVQPFDPSKFHFGKAAVGEVLFAFEPGSQRSPTFEEAAPAGASPNLVLINVSPIEYGHVLLVPRALERLPQLADAAGIALALRFAAELGNPNVRVGCGRAAPGALPKMRCAGWRLLLLLC